MIAMTSNRQREPEPEPSMYDRDCNRDDTIAALFFDHITESEFARRMSHEHGIEIVAFIVEARAREQGNG